MYNPPQMNNDSPMPSGRSRWGFLTCEKHTKLCQKAECKVHYSKVDMPNSVTYRNQTPTCEWYVVWCGSKNGYQKDMRSKEIGQCAQNMITILGSLVKSIRGGAYMTILWAQQIFTLLMNKIFIWAPTFMRKMATAWFEFSACPVLIVGFRS